MQCTIVKNTTITLYPLVFHYPLVSILKRSQLRIIPFETFINDSVYCHTKQVTKKIRDVAARKAADEGNLSKLANSVDAFTTALLDPLKSEDEARLVFGAAATPVVNKAIECKNKKVSAGRYHLSIHC